MKFHVSCSVFVEVVTFIFVPIIFLEIVHHHCSVGAYIEGVVDEIIVDDAVFHTIRIDFHSPSVVFEIIFIEIDFCGSVKENGDRVTLKNIVFDFTERNVF